MRQHWYRHHGVWIDNPCHESNTNVVFAVGARRDLSPFLCVERHHKLILCVRVCALHVCVCVFSSCIDHANRLTNGQTSVVAGKHLCVCLCPFFFVRCCSREVEKHILRECCRHQSSACGRNTAVQNRGEERHILFVIPHMLTCLRWAKRLEPGSPRR